MSGRKRCGGGRRTRGARKAVSEIVATLLMILVVVSIGATVFAYASGGLNSYGNSFSNLIGASGNQIAEDVVVEQVVFVNTGSPLTSGADLYVRNVGVNPSTIDAVYVQNATTSAFLEQFAGSPLPLTINSGSFQMIFVHNFVPDHGVTYSFTVSTSLGNTVIVYGKYN